MKKASVRQLLFIEPLPLPLSSRAYPDFLLHCSHRRPRMWFSLKRTARSRLKPQLSTGNLGKPRDLQFSSSPSAVKESETADASASLGVCDFLSSVVVCGRKAPKSICQEALPGSFDSAP